MVLHLYDSLLQGNRYHPCLWIPISHFSPSKLLVVRGWISSFIATYSNHLPHDAAWMPVWYAYLLSLWLQPYEPSVVHYSWIPDGMVKIWQENQEMKQWMCRKMELSEINRQDEPRSTKLFSFWGFLFANVSRVRPTARVGSLFHTKVPWCHGLLLIRILFQLPQILRISMYWCIGVSSPSVFWPVITLI